MSQDTSDGKFTTVGKSGKNLHANNSVQQSPLGTLGPVKFKGTSNPLSNFYHIKRGLHIYTHDFNSAEEAYQYRAAIAANRFSEAEEIVKCKDARRAKEIADNFKKAEDWKQQKLVVMEEVVNAKLAVCEEFRIKLQQLKGRELVEDTTHVFWAKGSSSMPGQNEMGKLLMKLADKLPEHVECQGDEVSSHPISYSNAVNAVKQNNVRGRSRGRGYMRGQQYQQQQRQDGWYPRQEEWNQNNGGYQVRNGWNKNDW